MKRKLICIVCPMGCHLDVDVDNDYAVTGNKMGQCDANYYAVSPGKQRYVTSGFGRTGNRTVAINALTVTLSTGTFSGGTYILYGVK